MKGILRATFRFLHLGVVIAVVFAEYFVQRPRGTVECANWMHRSAKRGLKALGMECRASGNFPPHGVLVSNHLSYLDILVFGALAPCVFVSKSEVRSWPVFGWLASLAGTVYVDRNHARTTINANEEIAAALDANVPLIFFPEGTTTDGSHILPFKSSLFAPGCAAGAAMHVAYLRYSLMPGNAASASVEQDVCYWADMTFFPHLLRLMALTGVRADVSFGGDAIQEADRKAAARECEAAVRALAEKAQASVMATGQHASVV